MRFWEAYHRTTRCPQWVVSDKGVILVSVGRTRGHWMSLAGESNSLRAKVGEL